LATDERARTVVVGFTTQVAHAVALCGAPIVERGDVEILAGAVDHHGMRAAVRALVATVGRALGVVIRAIPVGANAHAQHAGVDRAEKAVCAIARVGTEPDKPRTAGGSQRGQGQPEPE
jgi:hypothetical protein